LLRLLDDGSSDEFIVPFSRKQLFAFSVHG
jgi:hypothetical protein